MFSLKLHFLQSHIIIKISAAIFKEVFSILSDYTMKPKNTVAVQQLNKKFQIFFNVIILSHINDMFR